MGKPNSRQVSRQPAGKQSRRSRDLFLFKGVRHGVYPGDVPHRNGCRHKATCVLCQQTRTEVAEKKQRDESFPLHLWLLLYSLCCRLLEYLVVRYPVQVALGLFITVGGLLMAAFLAYQVCGGGPQAVCQLASDLHGVSADVCSKSMHARIMQETTSTAEGLSPGGGVIFWRIRQHVTEQAGRQGLGAPGEGERHPAALLLWCLPLLSLKC